MLKVLRESSELMIIDLVIQVSRTATESQGPRGGGGGGKPADKEGFLERMRKNFESRRRHGVEGGRGERICRPIRSHCMDIT